MLKKVGVLSSFFGAFFLGIGLFFLVPKESVAFPNQCYQAISNGTAVSGNSNYRKVGFKFTVKTPVWLTSVLSYKSTVNGTPYMQLYESTDGGTSWALSYQWVTSSAAGWHWRDIIYPDTELNRLKILLSPTKLYALAVTYNPNNTWHKNTSGYASALSFNCFSIPANAGITYNGSSSLSTTLSKTPDQMIQNSVDDYLLRPAFISGYVGEYL